MSLVVRPFRFETDKDAWSLGLFSREMDTVADVTLLDADVAATPAFGTTEVTFTASATAKHQVQLVWPDDETRLKELARFGIAVAGGEVGVWFKLEGKGEAAASAHVPAGALKIGLGASGGGSINYERFRAYSVTTAIPAVLEDAARSLRLPVQANTPDTLPAPGELLTVKLAGYLELSADVAWGAKVSNTRGVGLGELELEFVSKLTLAATAAAKYRLAGAFDVSCCRAGDRLRVVVHKSQEQTFSFAADFAMVADFQLDHLPKTADEFLGKLFGADADRVLRAIDRAQQFDSIEKIQAAAGEWAADTVVDLAEPLIGKALDRLDAPAVKSFLDALHKVTAQYTSLDERVARIYQDGLADIPGLTRALDALAGARDPQALKAVSDAAAWQLFRKVAGDRLYDALLDVEEYKRVLDVVDRARDFVTNGPAQVKAVIKTLQERLAIDPLIRRLAALSTGDQLKALVRQESEPQLRKLVSLLLAKPLDALQNFDAELQALQAALTRLTRFKDEWYKRLTDAANSSFTASVNVEYTRASAQDALLDVEIDVSSEEGQALAARAALGDFSGVLANAAQRHVTLRDAVLTHRVTRQSTLKVAVLGFELTHLTRLIADSQDRFQQTAAGLLLIHTFEVKSEEERRVRDEQTLTRFLIRGAAEGLVEGGDATRVHMVDTLRSLTAAYDFAIEDSKTSAEELVEYLVFAESLGLLESPARFVAALQQELPQGWTAITVEYVVRYDAAGVAAVFARRTDDLVAAAAKPLRNLIARVKLFAGREEAKIGAAFLDAHVRQSFKERGTLVGQPIAVTLPAWITRDKPSTVQLRDEHKQLLEGLLRQEALYLDRLAKLDRALDRIRDGGGGDARRVRTLIKTEDLDSIATDFVASGVLLPHDRKVNPFFGTFDALILESAPKARSAAVVLEITPKGGTDKVTKYLSS